MALLNDLKVLVLASFYYIFVKMVLPSIIKMNFKVIILFLFLSHCLIVKSQTSTFSLETLKPNPDKETKFLPYLALRHGGMSAVENWKKSNTLQYYKEMWYYSESFYVKRGYVKDGVPLNEEIIDISRFESSRKQNEEVIITLPGFQDALVLLPANKLVYKP